MNEVINTKSNSWLGLSDKVCVVTGAGSGIGAEVARQFATCGASVAILDVNEAAASLVASEIVDRGGRAIAVGADAGSQASMQQAACRVHHGLGPCTVLVNNAAVRNRSALIGIDLAAWSRVLEVNLTGALICSQAFVPHMIEAGKGGSLVHVASLVGYHPQPDGGAYSVSKAGMMMLSRLLSIELAPHRIRSNVVAPGFTRTPATEAAYDHAETAAARIAMIPAGRAATPTDLADVILFIASERASYINGQDLLVDGGFTNTLMTTVPKLPQKEST